METLTEIELAVSSPAFSAGQSIPSHYTCEGANVNPPLIVGNLPAETESLALIMEDPDAPSGTFDHWLVWNITPLGEAIKENEIPGVQGKNSFGDRLYGGPCPPDGEHRYFFKMFALNRMLDLREGSTKQQLLRAMQGHVLATGELMGRYTKTTELSSGIGQKGLQ